jgi:hypothetical protein
MAAVASPYGLRPVQLVGGLPFAGAIRSYALTANQATAFYFGDPVGMQAGVLKALTASPTTTVDANSPIGVFMGAEWQDPIRGFVNGQSFPAGGIAGGASKVKFKILDAPGCVWMVQANGPVDGTKIGLNTAIVAFGTGSTATGNSLVAASSAAGVAATLALKIIGFPDKPGSAPGDAFTDLLVIWNSGVHRYTAAAGF